MYVYNSRIVYIASLTAQAAILLLAANFLHAAKFSPLWIISIKAARGNDKQPSYTFS